MSETELALVPVVLLVAVVLLAKWWLGRRATATEFLPTQSLAPDAPDAPDAPASPAPGYFRAHLRGDYSLARSYWLHTLLLQSALGAATVALIPWVSDNYSARIASSAVLALSIGGVVLWFWAAAGTWASAGKHVARGGRPTWATLARIAIVLGGLRLIATAIDFGPGFQEHLRIAAGQQMGSPTTLQVRADGKSILLAGGINDGSAEQLEAALQRAPSVTTVVLSSEGGWIREGKLLGDVIRRHRLDTYVEQFCASACTLAFLAGHERAAAPSARIGFHAARAIGALKNAPPSTQLKRLYEEAGLPPAFVARAMATPHGQMWFPSQDVMLAAGVLTRRSLGGETAAMATSIRTRAALDEGMRKIELFALFEQRSPAVYKVAMDLAWARLQQGASDAQVTAALRGALMPHLIEYLPLATDDTLVTYQDLLLEEARALQARDAAACVELVFPSGQAMKLIGTIPPDLARREQALLTQVLREADESRRPKPDRAAVQQVARRAFQGMTPEQIRTFGDQAVRRRSSPQAVCAASIRFLDGIKAIPIGERGKALRAIYGNV